MSLIRTTEKVKIWSTGAYFANGSTQCSSPTEKGLRWQKIWKMILSGITKLVEMFWYYQLYPFFNGGGIWTWFLTNKIEFYVERYVWEFRYNFEVSLLSPTQPEQHLPSLFSRFLIKVGELHLARHFTLPTTSNTPQHNHNIISEKRKYLGFLMILSNWGPDHVQVNQVSIFPEPRA